MPFYHQLGNIPHKRHTVFKKPNGNYYYEELFGTVGFDGMSSLLYHCQRPTQVKKVLESIDVSPEIAVDKNMKSYALNGFKKTQLQYYINQLVQLEYIKQYGHGNKGYKYKIFHFDDIQSVRKKLKDHFIKQIQQLKPNTNEH